jgi:arylsulfatase A-like enzyme
MMLRSDRELPTLGVRRAAIAGALLGTLTMLGFLFQPTFELVNTFAGHKVLRSIVTPDALRGRLLVEMLAFATALLASHIAFGLCSALAAIGTLAGFRSSRSAGPVKLTILWHFALLVWVVGASATLYPRSNAGVFYFDFFSISLGGVTLIRAYTVALLLALLLVAIKAVPLSFRPVSRRTTSTALSLAAIASIAAIVSRDPLSAEAAADPTSSRPNVIIIGIDSLRIGELRRFGGTGGLTPNVDQMLEKSVVYRDTVTPMARTFPAWVSILTGRYPDRTGATINLIARTEVHARPTLADTLRASGYETIYATDEVRFSNIDAGYGFDQTITPRIGAADFLLGTFNDFPVSNVLANTAVGGWLFPHTYANRAAYSRYLGTTFADRLDSELEVDAPVFLAVHLTAAHWPYVTAETPDVPNGVHSPEADYLQYRRSLALVDRQLGDILSIFEKKGLMRNAVVVLLSDHGEALAQPGDRLIPKDIGQIHGATRPIEVGTFGHGSSVLSPVQFQVLLAMQGTGEARDLLPQPGDRMYPATLVDIAPTVLHALGIKSAATMDGVDLACECAQNEATRIRFTETEFTLPMMMAGQVNPAMLVSQGIDYYSVDPDSGWLELRADKLREIDTRRERAAISRRFILAALPTFEGNSRFVLADRETGESQILLTATAEDREIFSLWQALHAKYGRFLGAPAT